MSELNEKTYKGSVHDHPLSSDEVKYEDDAVTPEGRESDALNRQLKSRHISMIAIGGALGTGLIIGTGEALATAGPGSILISYSLVGIIVWLVMTAIGEMAAWLPLSSGFTGFATRFCDEALGFTVGWTYWCKYIITTPNQLVASALVIQYWVPPEKVNPGVFVAVFLVVIIFINAWGTVGFFGEFEFWASSLKVLIITCVILGCFILAVGGGPTGDRPGFRYWHDPGAFKPYLAEGSTGNFAGIWNSMVTAVFAYLGTELVGVTVGEAKNPRRAIPRAIKLTFWRILFFYILGVLFLGMNVPYDSDMLLFANDASTGNAAASPFVVAVKIAQIPNLPGILNAGFLVFTFSAANSDLYIATRTLYGLAGEGKAPALLRYKNKNKIPVVSLAVCSSIACIAFMSVKSSSTEVFKYFVNMVSMFGLLTWISVLITHIYFVRARKAQGVSKSSMAYTAPFGVVGSYVALVACCVIALTKNFDVFVGTFDYENFITGYLGIPIYIALLAGFKIFKRPKGVKPETADLWSGKAKIDAEEQEFLAQQAQKKEARRGKGGLAGNMYKFVSWLF